jgi:predicted nucleic acid-binding protein
MVTKVRDVAAWADRVDAADLYLSIITVEELEIGVLLTQRRDVQRQRHPAAWRGRQQTVTQRVITMISLQSLGVNP